jgi:hypothetical protein
MRSLKMGTSLSLSILLVIVSAASAGAQGVNPEYPKIRAVTAFVNVDKDAYTAQID